MYTLLKYAKLRVTYIQLSIHSLLISLFDIQCYFIHFIYHALRDYENTNFIVYLVVFFYLKKLYFICAFKGDNMLFQSSSVNVYCRLR